LANSSDVVIISVCYQQNYCFN